MKKVITYGSFDLFHEGHYNLLKRAKELGDYLIVGITTEHYDISRGKLNVINPLMKRIENVQKCGFADEIIIEDHAGQKIEDIIKHHVDIFTVGSDWVGVFDYLQEYCEVVYIERTKGISSTMLRETQYEIVRLGIIGSGRIADRIVPEAKYVSGLNIEAVYNPNLASAQNFAEKHQLGFASDDLTAFFAKINAVYIASPHQSHYDYIMQALNAGKHVLSEKPIALKEKQAIDAYQLAKEKNLILLEGIKTAYCPGFIRLHALAKSGVIGTIKDVEATFTKLISPNQRELTDTEAGGSLTELGSYTLLAAVKFLGTEFDDIRFDYIPAENGLDIYTKVYLRNKRGFALSKTGLGVKSDGQLIIAGTKGYIKVEAPWWKTSAFEICFEDTSQNEKAFIKFEGEGLRYELSSFVATINGSGNGQELLSAEESVAIVRILERFLLERAKKNSL